MYDILNIFVSSSNDIAPSGRIANSELDRC